MTRREGCYARLMLRQATKLGSTDKTHYIKIATHPSMEGYSTPLLGGGGKNLKKILKAYKTKHELVYLLTDRPS